MKLNSIFKNFIKIMLMAVITIHLSQCGGNSLVNDANGNSSDFVMLKLSSIHHLHDGTALAPTDSSTKIFDNDLGYEIELIEAEIYWGKISLDSVGLEAFCQQPLDSELVVRNEFSLNRIENILDMDLMALELGDFSIASRSYCQMEIELGADGRDAFTLSGTWRKGEQGGEFEFQSSELMHSTLTFKVMEDGEKIDHPLHFEGDEQEANVMLGNKYNLWFDGVDFANQNQSLSDQEELVRNNIKTYLHQHLDMNSMGHH